MICKLPWAVTKKYSVPVATGTIRVMARSTGAVMGASVMIAKGELENIGTGILGGSSAGNKVVDIVSDNVKNATKVSEKFNEVVETWKEGAKVEEKPLNKKLDKVFKNVREYED